MGNQVTAHNTINSVRTDIVTETKTLKNCFQELFANMKCKATSQANISGEIDEIVNYLKKTENNLCSAQQAATALAGVNRKVAEKNISINVFSAVSGIASMHPIDINPDGANQALGGFRGCAQRLELKIDILNRCKKEISALPESEQNISSVSTIDSIFAGLVGGIKSAVTKVKTVKQQCVSGLKNAVSNLQKAITCIRDIGNENGRYAKLIAEFAACDANIINRYKISRYSDVLMRTRQYNGGTISNQSDLRNDIESAKTIQNSIETITCEECIELRDEVTRLKKFISSPPLDGNPRITSPYGKRDLYGSFHYGVDFGVGEGTSVKSVTGGTIIASYWQTGGGNCIYLLGDDGYVYEYAHLSQRLFKDGDRVEAGQEIALSGKTGQYVTGAHLHLGIYKAELALKNMEATGANNLKWQKNSDNQWFIDGSTDPIAYLRDQYGINY